jgi:hypothetical protein
LSSRMQPNTPLSLSTALRILRLTRKKQPKQPQHCVNGKDRQCCGTPANHCCPVCCRSHFGLYTHGTASIFAATIIYTRSHTDVSKGQCRMHP